MDLNNALKMEMDATSVLIDLVKQFTFLYDKKSKDFKNKSAREKAWKYISDKLYLTRQKCELKWNSLRNRYCTERRNLRKFPSENGVSDWKYFNHMSFLDKHILSRSPLELDVPIHPSLTKLIFKNDLNEENETTEEDEIARIISEEDLTDCASTVVNYASTCEDEKVKLSKDMKQEYMSQLKEKKRKIVKTESLDNVLKTMTRIKNTLTPPPNEGNNSNLFALHVGNCLDNMKAKKRAKAKIKIMEVLEEFISDDE